MKLLILVSSPQFLLHENETLVKLFRAGLEIFHLRKPDCPEQQIREYLNLIPAGLHNRIVLHSHYHLASEYNLRGIHLTEKTKHTCGPDWEAQRMKNQTVSASFHRLEDVRQISCHYDYIFLSPVFDSISKEDYTHAFSETEIEGICDEMKARPHPIPIVGLGGVDISNIMKIKAMKLSGAALLGAVWQQADPVEAFIRIQQEYNNA
jgi:thiamine-phosphate pyrophosphorylase